MKSYVSQFKEFVNKVKRIDFSKFFNEDVTNSEFLILDIISDSTTEKEEKWVWISDIVDSVPVTAQAVSKTLRSMENKGYIERFVNKDDRRMTGVKILEKGIHVYESSMREIEEFVGKLEEGFEEGEREEFIRLSIKFEKIFIDNLNIRLSKNKRMEDIE